MKTMRLALPPLLIAFAALGVASFQDPVTSDHEEEHEPETELGEQMERVEDAMRLLRRSVRKPESRLESLAQVQQCQEGLILAKRYEPAMLAHIPEGERAAFVRDFRLEVNHTLGLFLELEAALLREEHEKARELYKKAKGAEEPAHDRFTEDE